MSRTFVVTVKGAAAQLSELATAVGGGGTGTSLRHTVRKAQHSLAAGNRAGACSTVNGFTGEVGAQTGRTIPNTQADRSSARLP